MVIVILGAPGVGKGSLAGILSKYYNIPHISTGQIIREKIEENSEQSKLISDYVNKGELVPDDIMIKVISVRLKRKDCSTGFILDGFPRTKEQAEKLDELFEQWNIHTDLILELTCSKETILERITGRRICMNCRTIYHTKNLPPLEENICDKCKGPLIQRKDDTVDTILRRLEVYKEETEPLITYYRQRGKLTEISGEGSVNKAFEKIKEMI